MESTICAQCGYGIEPMARQPDRWQHAGGYRPRHIATPAREQTDPLADARARVLTGLRRNLMHSGYGHADAQQRAEALLDAYAHELAEQIRADATGIHGGAYDGRMAAADLIDPEAQQ